MQGECAAQCSVLTGAAQLHTALAPASPNQRRPCACHQPPTPPQLVSAPPCTCPRLPPATAINPAPAQLSTQPQPHPTLLPQRAERPGEGGAAAGAAAHGAHQLRLHLPRPPRQERDAAGAGARPLAAGGFAPSRRKQLQWAEWRTLCAAACTLCRGHSAPTRTPTLLAVLQVGAVHSTRLGEDDSKTLKQLNFQVRCACGWGLAACMLLLGWATRVYPTCSASWCLDALTLQHELDSPQSLE